MTAPIAFFGGKGGVGKTTLATAWALRRAERGARTLLVSTDPAHSTADLLGVRLGNRPTRVAERLDALEVDADADAAAYVDRIKADARATLSPAVAETVAGHLDLAASSPGTVESALFDRVADLLQTCLDDYDHLAFDTAPTGHTLRLLALPSLLGRWVDGLVARRRQAVRLDAMAGDLGRAGPSATRADPVVERLEARRARLVAAGERLRHETAFHLVCVPERLAVAETRRAAATLADAGVTVASVVVNRALPAGRGFLAARRAQDARHREAIAAAFPDVPVVTVHESATEPDGPDALAGLADQLGAIL